MRQELAKDTYNVLHFMGHGLFDRASGEGMLAFEGADGAPDLVSGKAFATKLKDLRSLGVVMLNACNTARAGQAGGGNPFRGVATALVLGGVPAVVAMQKPISDRAAISFSTAFYRHLASGDSVDEALTEGRQAIHSAKPDSFEWATPVLFLRLPEGNVFEARPAPAPEEPERRQPSPAILAAAGARSGPSQARLRAQGRGRRDRSRAGERRAVHQAPEPRERAGSGEPDGWHHRQPLIPDVERREPVQGRRSAEAGGQDQAGDRLATRRRITRG